MVGFIKCRLGYHDFTVVRQLSKQASKLVCGRCNKKWAMNYDMRIMIPWDSEVEQFYDNAHARGFLRPTGLGRN